MPKRMLDRRTAERPGSVGKAYIPDRGDIVWIDMNPQAGREQAGRRPAVVVSPAAYNGKVGLALLVPITSRQKGYPFEVAMPESSQVRGVVLSDQVRSLDWRARHAEFREKLPPATVEEILGKIGTLFG